MIIRNPKISESLEISKIHAKEWRNTYKNIIPYEKLATVKDDMWLESNINIIKNKKANIYIAENVGKILGDIVFGKSRKEINCGEIYAIYVLKEYQNLGIGSSLFKNALDKLLKEYQRVQVKVLLENHNARKFYEKFNFKLKNVEKSTIFDIELDLCVYEYSINKVDKTIS